MAANLDTFISFKIVVRKERFRNNFSFCLENFEAGARNFENRTASLAFLSADRKRKKYAADDSKFDDNAGSYLENVPKEGEYIIPLLTPTTSQPSL